jgi:hypothetical protein
LFTFTVHWSSLLLLLARSLFGGGFGIICIWQLPQEAAQFGFLHVRLLCLRYLAAK